MSELQVWLAIAGITLSTVLARSTLHLAGARLRLPPGVESALRYAPACALAAIIAPELLLDGGSLRPDWGNPKLAAGAVAAVIFAATRSTLGTIVGGMAAFWLVRSWFPG